MASDSADQSESPAAEGAPEAAPVERTRTQRATEFVLDVALREGSQLARTAIRKQMARAGISSLKLEEIEAGESFRRRLAASAIARMASRSVPGTLLVSGGLIAKALYEKRRQRREQEAIPPGESNATETGGPETDGPK